MSGTVFLHLRSALQAKLGHYSIGPLITNERAARLVLRRMACNSASLHAIASSTICSKASQPTSCSKTGIFASAPFWSRELSPGIVANSLDRRVR